MMHHKPFHAPVTTPKRILDIGCGTGAMTYVLATAFPDAEVVGLDISPVPEGRYERPRNLRYVQGNVMELEGEAKEVVREGSFNYIFHRLLVLGMTDWPGYLKKVEALLAPGGWAEMQDYDLSVLNAAGERASDGWWHWSCFREDAEAMGLDTAVGTKLGKLMETAGLVGVEEKLYDVPCCFHEGLPEHLKPVGRHMGTMMEMDGYAAALMTRVCKGRRSEEELAKMIAEGNAKYKAVQAGDHAKMGVAWGQKAG